MKRLTIRNFGPITDVELDLKRLNIILGPQSSGKSTVLKVACFCDWMERQIALSQNPDKYCNPAFFVQNLVTFHKLEGFMHQDTYFRYENDAISFDYDAKTNKCKYYWAQDSRRWKYRKSKIAYIPSERNLVAAIPNWYQVSMNNNNILDFMKEWEFARKFFSKKEPILGLPVGYRYNPNDNGDRIVLHDGKELPLTNASSGLQSLIPLFVMVKYLTYGYFKEEHSKIEDLMIKDNLLRIVSEKCAHVSPEKQKEIVESMVSPSRSDLYIEEPESHIFPSTQRDFIYFLVSLLNGQRKHFCFIATHSPYLLTALNNLIQAGELIAQSKEMALKIGDRFTKRGTMRFDEVAAFFMENGRAESILDNEYKLISAEALDRASQEIAEDFNFLLNL